MAMPKNDKDNRIDLREILKERANEINPHGKLRFVPAKDLKIDHRYQRQPNRSRIKRISKDFKPQIFGTIDVSERENGELFIINGQHRVGAVIEMGKGETPVPCIVHTGLDYPAEAMMFHLMNSLASPLTAQEKLKGAIEAGDEDALEIRDIVERSGLSLNLEGSDRSGGKIPGVGALIRTHKEYQDGHLENVLNLISATWGTREGPRNTFIDGMSIFLSYYRDVWDRKRFIAQLRRVEMETIFVSSRQVRDVLGVSTGLAVAYKIVENYNHGILTKNKIPSIEEMRAINKMKGRNNG